MSTVSANETTMNGVHPRQKILRLSECPTYAVREERVVEVVDAWLGQLTDPANLDESP